MEKFVRGLVKKQALRIIYFDMKNFNHHRVHFSAKAIYLKQNFNIQTLYYTVAYFYKKEKGRLQKKLTRIKTNSKIQDLKNKYDLIDVELLTYYLNITDILNFKTPKHYEHLEQMIKIIIREFESISTCNKYNNYKYIKKIQNQIKIVDVNLLACYINSFKGFNFKSKHECELLENIIKITLSIPIGIVNQTKLRPWQVDIKINMENKFNLIKKYIKKNLNENVGIKIND